MKSQKPPFRCLLGILVHAGICLTGASYAQTATWNKTAAAEWTTPANWTWTGTMPTSGLPDEATTVAIFNNGTISLKNSTQSIFAMTMNNGRLEITRDSTASILNFKESLVIGSNAGTSASILIDGLGSELIKVNATNQIHIGGSGNGLVTVSNGGKLTSAGVIHIGVGSGNGATGVGILNVNTGGQAIINSTFILGYRGNGTMNIESGGYVKSSNGFIAGYGPDANRVQGTASVKVSGTGSKWDTGVLYVGHTGTGTMLVEDGGSVVSTSTGWIGYLNAGPPTAPVTPSKYGTGTVTVQTGGLWQSAGAIGIGTSGSTGTLNVASGGRINVNGGSGAITLGTGGVMNVGANPLITDAVPVAPGIISAGSITSADFGRTLTFFHNDLTGSYHFTKTGLSSGGHVAITGTVKLNALTGTTVLTGANAFTGGTLIGGDSTTAARLVLKHSQAMGTGLVTVKNNGTLEISSSLDYAVLGSLLLEGGSALALKASPVSDEWAHVIELSGGLDVMMNPGEKIKLYLSGTSAITNPELYDWTFLRANGGIYTDMTDLFEVISDVPGFYVFQRDDALVIGMIPVVPEPGRFLLSLIGLTGIVFRRRRV